MRRVARHVAVVSGAAALLGTAIFFCAWGEWAGAALVGAGAALGALALAAPEAALGVWVAASPWASYILKYPAERSLLTFDRVAVACIVFALVRRARRRGEPWPKPWLCE